MAEFANANHPLNSPEFVQEAVSRGMNRAPLPRSIDLTVLAVDLWNRLPDQTKNDLKASAIAGGSAPSLLAPADALRSKAAFEDIKAGGSRRAVGTDPTIAI